MKRLAGASEHLDGPLDPALLGGTLRDLERVNRWLGGARLSWRAIEPYMAKARPDTLRLIDVGTGAADIPRALLDAAKRRGASLEIVATDVRPEIVSAARARSRAHPNLEVLEAAEERIAHHDDSFDVAHASLVLHHLEPDEARAVLAEMRRVARAAVVINDLARAPLWLLGARLLTVLGTRNPYTRHDAPLSVRRAYTAREMIDLAAGVGLRHVRTLHTLPPYRYALVFVRDGAGRD